MLQRKTEVQRLNQPAQEDQDRAFQRQYGASLYENCSGLIN
jgi:hypothetical protein